MEKASTTQHPKRERTCIACRTKSARNDFFRIVRLPEGDVCFDEKGKMPGRGAYVCSLDCFNTARARKQFDKALRCKVSDEDYQIIALAIGNAQKSAKKCEV